MACIKPRMCVLLVTYPIYRKLSFHQITIRKGLFLVQRDELLNRLIHALLTQEPDLFTNCSYDSLKRSESKERFFLSQTANKNSKNNASFTHRATFCYVFGSFFILTSIRAHLNRICNSVLCVLRFKNINYFIYI